MSVCVYLAYEASGAPFTIARITNLEAIQEVARLAVAEGEARVAACLQIDPLLAQTEQLELQRLRATIALLVGQIEGSEPAQEPQLSTAGVM